MYKNIKHILFILPALLLMSCKEEVLISGIEEEDVEYSDTMVDFLVGLPESMETRGVDNPKTYFSIGDVIHIEANFFDEANGLISRNYKAYEMNAEGKWQASSNTNLYWPINAKKGGFKAFFVSNMKDVLLPDDRRRELRLSDVTDQTDPLMAEISDIAWGHRVNLQFTHLCTHLTFTGLEPDITDYFWLINKKYPLKNVFTLKLNSDKQLESEWLSVGDESFGGLVYVQQRTKNLYDSDNIKIGSQVSFFLAPGDYSDVALRTINNYSYLEYQGEFTSNLEANVPYVIDIKTNRGATFVEDSEDWDDKDYEVKIMEPDKFLQAIVEEEEYEIVDEETQEKRKIIEKTSSGTRLCCNVSFDKSKNYVKRDIPSSSYFDGGNHYITDLATNLFATNYGTIRHLGLKDIECTEELWYRNTDETYNFWGALCETNEGDIENIRIEKATLTFKIGEGRDQSGYVFNVGMVVGVNRSKLSELSFDNITINGVKTDDEAIQSTVNIGGIVGQSVKDIKDVQPITNNSKIEIRTNLSGEMATLYIGGAAGQSGGNLQGISLPNVIIDASQSQALRGNIGGLVGRLRGTGTSPSEVSSCTIKGEVKGVSVNYYNNIKAYSYTGGIAGYDFNYNVKNCRSVCNVEMDVTVSLDGNNTYGTGGGFGRIINKENIISGNYIWGSGLEGPQGENESGAAYVGNFAGIVPLGVSWSDYEKEGNIAQDLISGQFIGAQIDDTPPTD